jgi:SOS-response transcriptional repressor LexA
MAKSGEKKKRYDRATKELIILEFINKYGKENGGYPSLDAIKKGVSNYMSKRTVDRIISDIEIRDICKNHPSKLKLSEFLNSMCQYGMKGNIPAGKLWLALAFGWTEKKMFEIFDRLKEPDKYDYSKLTDEELKTVIDILSKAKKETDNSINIVLKPV